MRHTLTVAVLVAAGLTAGTGPAMAAAEPDANGLRAYFVITAPNATAGAKAAIPRNGGTVFTAYDQIGVVVAHSANPTFAARMRAVPGVQQAGATRTSDVPAAALEPAIPPAPPQAPITMPENPQADMTQIGADRAWAKNGGSPQVTVGVLDTGIDDEHPDLKPNFDASKSASCAYGKLDTRAGAWRPVDMHGTHVAGTIAAAQNDNGVVGVAPKVKVSAIRVAEAGSTLFFPENTVCAFMFAGDKRVDITNNSYYTDPWLFNCPSQLDQKAILEAVKRSVAYAEDKGVLHISAAGNDTYDLAEKSTDGSSPNDSDPVRREVSNDCLSLPTELPGVVSVSSVNGTGAKSSFSNYGTDKVHVAAPGDNVVSTVPGGRYGPASGTSMASPHVAGVAALLQSVNLKATPAQLRERLLKQANDLACPATGDCTGEEAKNSYFGEGLVDAAEAVGAPGGQQPQGSGGTIKLKQPADQLGFGALPVGPIKIELDGGSQQKLRYRAAGLPPGLAISPDGVITGVAEAGASKYRVTITASSDDGGTGWTSFTWWVWSF